MLYSEHSQVLEHHLKKSLHEHQIGIEQNHQYDNNSLPSYLPDGNLCH